ncbi:MAG: LysR substrate-binding domain-containing protein, partial [Pseudomonadota bacterium]
KHLDTLRAIDVIAREGSIRRAAETLSITSTALNRRVLALEAELGAPIFERLPRGVRLSSAGEILVTHARNQISDMERVRSRIADLSGVRRGHVSVAASQALLPYFLPEEIARYRQVHQAVTFGVHRRDRDAAEGALADHSADLALVFEPVRMTAFQTLAKLRQPICAILHPAHALAGRRSVRLHECMTYPLGLPTRAYGVRHLLEAAAARLSLDLAPTLESDSFEFLRSAVVDRQIVSFQIPVGLPREPRPGDVVTIPLDPRDVPAGLLHMGQLRGRTLPVAAAKFAEQLVRTLETDFSP